MTDEELSKAAEESAKQYYIDGGYSPFPNVETASHKSGFLAGAKWMEAHTPLPEDTVLFNKGVAEGRRLESEENKERDIVFWRGIQYAREQMMREAVECYYGYVNNCTKVFLPEETLKGIKEGYVKIVILKNDECSD